MPTKQHLNTFPLQIAGYLMQNFEFSAHSDVFSPKIIKFLKSPFEYDFWHSKIQLLSSELTAIMVK